jgi:hypothetical protein
MKLCARLLRVGAGLTLALTTGLVLGCSDQNPIAPTRLSPSTASLSLSDSTAVMSHPVSGRTSWSCLTATGVAPSPAECGSTRIGLSSVDRGVAAAVPGTSSNLSAAVNGTTVVLNWSAGAGSDPATSYVVEAGSATGRSDLAVFDTGNPATTLTVTSVPAGTYFVRVRSRNSSGVSAPSNEITVIVGAPPGGVPPGGGPPAGPSITGRWIGLAANGDGFISPVDPRFPQCPAERSDVQLDLVQTGNQITGTGTTRLAVSRCRPDRIGTTDVQPLNLTLDASRAFSLTQVETFNDGSRASLNFSGVFGATRLTGTSTLTDLASGFSISGRFAANKQ